MKHKTKVNILKEKLSSKIILSLILILFLEGFIHNFQTSIYDFSFENNKIETERLRLSDPVKEHYILNWTKEVGIIYHGVATDSEGNVYFVGEGSSWDYSLLKYSSNGTLLWSRKRSIIDVDQAMAVVVDSEDNVYISGWCVVGSTEGGGHIVTIKYNKTGNLEWQEIFGSENRVYDMTIDNEDNLYISGHTEEFGASSSNKDMLILKYNSDGTLLWYRRSELSGNDFGYGIEYNSNNGLIFVTGSHAGNLILFMYDKNGNLIDTTYWNNGGSESGKDISINQNTGKVYVSGSLGFSYVVFDSIGNNIQNVTGSSQDTITVDHLGRIFVSKAISYPSPIILVSKFFSDGSKLWDLTLDYWDTPQRMASSIDRSVYIVSYNGRLIKLKIDDINPIINITSPTSSEIFGKVAPDITLEIEEPNLNETWYFLSNSSISTPNMIWEGEISQDVWDIFINGNVSINICANDSNNNFGFGSVNVTKDSVLPTINLLDPIEEEIFGEIPPNFTVIIHDTYLDEMWYTIDGGMTNITFTINGTLNQSEWTKCSDGLISLTFYAKDIAGNEIRHQINIYKDTSVPLINIITPSLNQYLSGPPIYNITINEPNLDSYWYTLDGGITNISLSEFYGTLEAAEWYSALDGLNTLRFYANDSLSYENFAEITIIKDTINPKITIISPTDDQEYLWDTPRYWIEIDEINLDHYWYTLDGGMNNHTITLVRDLIERTVWDDVPEGNVTIEFYVEDFAGNIGSSYVIVIKQAQPPIPAPEIPGYNIFFILGVLSVITVIILRKRLKS